MRKHVYDTIHNAEAGWWYKGRFLAMKALLERAGVNRGGERALDLGAGYGAMFTIFSGHKAVNAVEIYPEAQEACRSKGYAEVFASVDDLVSAGQQYDTIGVFDVLEHFEDDERLLKQLYVLLKPDGTLLITVPAHQFLFSQHDEDSKHFRRYSKRLLKERLANAGFDIKAMSYWNSLLFPIAAILRLMRKLTVGSITPSPLVNSILEYLMKCEAILLRYTPLPMGVSIALVAKKMG